jgi:hypothetical protein
MGFDRYGRLLIGDFPGLFVTNGDTLELLTPPGFSSVSSSNFWSVDGGGRIFFSNEVGPPYDTIDIRIVTANGTLLEEPFMSFVDSDSNFRLAFSPFDSVWKGDLLTMDRFGVLRRVDRNASVTKFGHGFEGGADIVFGPDGALYVSDTDDNVIYRITPTDLQTASIDIKPGSCSNRINLKSKHKIPVAILSSMDFSAPEFVDSDSLTFGPTGEEDSLAFCRSCPKDVNDDGYGDLVCHFYTQIAGFKCGDSVGVLNGQTVDETPLEGSDSVRIVPCACR